MEIVETLVLKPVPVTQMLSVKSMTHCQREQCLANVKMGTPIRMDIVRKSVRKLIWHSIYLKGKSSLKLTLNIVVPLEIGCSSNRDCPTTQACRNRKCINPCVTENNCAPKATCIVEDHRTSCYCPPGFTGDPYRSCSPGELLLNLK